ncbi:hypothetical protein, partial [Pseudomonas aeruginosa]|uniref:hypothetical protein n=1 Tax=Pseudomonas aeruginosa TaxID=287 RepID=UPI002884184B
VWACRFPYQLYEAVTGQARLGAVEVAFVLAGDLHVSLTCIHNAVAAFAQVSAASPARFLGLE